MGRAQNQHTDHRDHELVVVPLNCHCQGGVSRSPMTGFVNHLYCLQIPEMIAKAVIAGLEAGYRNALWGCELSVRDSWCSRNVNVVRR